MKLGILLLLILRRSLSGAADSHVHLFVADVVKSFDTVEIGVFWIVSCLVLASWLCFVMLIFEYHAHVRLRFKLASDLGSLGPGLGASPRVAF